MDVIFFPRNDYPNKVEICDHRLGKKMTYCDITTMIPKLVSEKLLPLFVGYNQANNLRVSCFFHNDGTLPTGPYSSYLGPYVMQQIANNVIWPDMYFYPDPINDYTEEAVTRAWNSLQPWFIDKFGMKPIGAVFSSNVQSYKQYTYSYFLSVESDAIGSINGNTDYGVGVGNPSNVPFSLSRYFPRVINSRVLDFARADNEDYATYINQMATLIDQTLALPRGGFIGNFSHWHDLLYLDYDKNTGDPIPGRNDYAINNGFKPYYNMLAAKNQNNEIYFAGFGEAMAYLVFRELITRVVMYSPTKHSDSQLAIRLETQNTLSVNTELLQVPISVKFSTVGTPLENRTIQSENNLISLGGGEYIVEIPFSQFPGALITAA